MVNIFKTISAIAVMGVLSSPLSQGAVIFTLTEDSGFVTLAGSGTLNINDLTKGALNDSVAFMQPNVGDFQTGAGSGVYRYAIPSGGPAFIGSGHLVTGPVNASGDRFGIYGIDSELVIQGNYVSNTPIAGTVSWAGTFASLGITPGQSYVWNWGTGPNADSLTLNVAVPEPSEWAMIVGLISMIGVVGARSLQRRKASEA